MFERSAARHSTSRRRTNITFFVWPYFPTSPCDYSDASIWRQSFQVGRGCRDETSCPSLQGSVLMLCNQGALLRAALQRNVRIIGGRLTGSYCFFGSQLYRRRAGKGRAAARYSSRPRRSGWRFRVKWHCVMATSRKQRNTSSHPARVRAARRWIPLARTCPWRRRFSKKAK